jgi:hypothetical protein
LCNPKVHYRLHMRPPPVPVLSQISPSHFSNTGFNIILPSTPRSSKWSVSIRFRHQNLIY